MDHRLELQRVLRMPSPKGVDRIVATLFSAPNVPVGGAVVVSLPLSIERGTAIGAPRDHRC
jgi:hypothetical protein